MQSQDIATMPLDQALTLYGPEFQAALPDSIPLARFRRVVLTALNLNPELVRCERRSLFLACIRAAQDGLYPDGREAALVPYKGHVQYQPMVHGIRKRMQNSGKVASATAELVYKNDTFRVIRGDNPRIEHEAPALDEPRGEMIGAYAIIRLTNGDVVREVMSKTEIERIRDLFSKASRSDAPWKVHPGEMWRKTVLKRAAKQVPFASEDERLARMLADDERPTVEADYSRVPMPTSALPPRPGMEGNGHAGPYGQLASDEAAKSDAADDDDLTPHALILEHPDEPPDDDERRYYDPETGEVADDAPIDPDDAPTKPDAATAGVPQGELSIKPFDPADAIPFDGSSSQAWYKVARAHLEEMRRGGAAPAQFKMFAAVNQDALATLKGPGPNAFRSLWLGLDRVIKEGTAAGR